MLEGDEVSFDYMNVRFLYEKLRLEKIVLLNKIRDLEKENEKLKEYIKNN